MFRSGQHFLVNQSVLKKIAGALDPAPFRMKRCGVDIKKNDVVIEIGAGHGELTRELRIMDNELRIIAIEKDRGLASALREKFTHDKNIEIIAGDALKILPSLIENCKLKIENYKLVGNIPYYITGKLLRMISELKRKPNLCVFTLQKEVAERLAEKPPRMSRIAASVQFWAEPEIIGYVSRNDFEPAPEVDSVIILLATRVRGSAFAEASADRQGSSGIVPEQYYRTVRILFQQPRKTTLNNLAANNKKMKKEILAAKLEKAGIDPALRPQNLSIEDIVRIARLLDTASVPVLL